MRQIHWDNWALSLYGILTLIFILYGCGGTPGTSSSPSTSGGGDTTLTTTAKAPSSASASLSRSVSSPSSSSSSSVSASKSVGKGSSTFVSSEVSEKPVVKVSKAAVADVAITNGTATLTNTAGTVIDTATPDSNGKCTFQFNASDLGGQPPIVTIETIVNGKTVKLQNAYSKVPSAGDKIDLGETNAKVSYAMAQALKGMGVSGMGADLASKASLFTNSFKTIALNLSGSAGSSAATNGQDAVLNMANKFAECMASGVCDDPFDAFDSSQMKSFDSNFDTNSAKAVQFGSALVNSYNSSSVLANLEKAGDDYRKQCFNLMAKMDDYTGVSTNPSFFRNYFDSNATEFISKGASAVSDWGNAGFAKTFVRLGEQCAGGSCDTATVDDYFEKMSAAQFTAMGNSPGDFAKSYGKLFLQADTAAERANMLSNPDSYYNVCANGCGAMTGGGGATVAADLFNTVSAGKTDFKPCYTNSDCSGIQTCSLNGHFCEDSTECTSNCSFGKVCTSDLACATGLKCITAPGEASSRCSPATIFTGGTQIGNNCTTGDDFVLNRLDGCWTLQSRSICLDSLTIASGQLTIDTKNVGNTSCRANGTPFGMNKRIPANSNFTIILSIVSWSNLDTSGANYDGFGLLVADPDDVQLPVRLDMRVVNAGGDKQNCYLSNDDSINESENTVCNVGANYSGGMCLKLVRSGTNVVGSFKTGTSCSVASGYTNVGTVTNFTSGSSGSAVNIVSSDGNGAGTLTAVIEDISIQ